MNVGLDNKVELFNLALLDFIKDIAFRTKKVLIDGDCRTLGELFNEHWEYKKVRSAGMSTKKIDEWYAKAMKNGAVGGKLVGAGGGGFLMFYADDKDKLRAEMARNGLQEMRFSFDFEGTKVIHS
jgi:D-glycero-alpha-D-manno-heptose-7-phosphate kinase